MPIQMAHINSNLTCTDERYSTAYIVAEDRAGNIFTVPFDEVVSKEIISAVAVCSGTWPFTKDRIGMAKNPAKEG